MTLIYSGLVVELLGDGRGRNFHVISMELGSPKWAVAPAVSIGAKAKDIQEMFGQPLEKKIESGIEVWSYVNKGNDGFAGFYFEDGRLVAVRWKSTLC